MIQIGNQTMIRGTGGFLEVKALGLTMNFLTHSVSPGLFSDDTDNYPLGTGLET